MLAILPPTAMIEAIETVALRGDRRTRTRVRVSTRARASTRVRASTRIRVHRAMLG